MDVDAAFSLIARALDAGRAAHGYLIVGDIETQGEPLVERILGKLFPDAREQVAAKAHPDIAYLKPAGKKRIIRIDDMRDNIVAPMSATSYSGGWKVGIISSADRMEPPSANAFLKSLEEPTPKTLYLLLTDAPDALLPTIVSRTQRIDLPHSEALLEADARERVSDAFAAKDAKALSEILTELKDAAGDDGDLARVRKCFYGTLASFVRQIMLSGKIPRYLAFRNIEAVEDAYRQSARAVNDDAVLAFLVDRLTFPAVSDAAP